jgi:hypothetical protein
MRAWSGSVVAAVALALALAACNDVVSLQGSQAQPITVSGQKMQVRVAPAGEPGMYRLVAQRTTIVINPDSELERERGYRAARPYMEQQCKGPYDVLLEKMVDQVNLVLVFQCKVTWPRSSA